MPSPRRESNVWRLYEALDRTKPDQVAYYIKGVGTSGWRPFAALDGATGVGVPSNVRKLYRFLCWNWQPGDKIYIFGFSRGSFTARTLAAMIASQGLVPATIDGVPVSRDEMLRNAMAAWREYRRASVPWFKSLPTIWLARFIRDIVLAVYHFIMRHRTYADVRKAMDGRSRIEIEFLGLFDTVEAFGVPVEELRTAIDWAIWPISFRNRVMSGSVKRARHALSLDDERTTFHPIRFDQSRQNDQERIEEVWFAGVHSDIGGGYPDGTLSYVPLVWMAEQVEQDLRFQPGQIDHFRTYQSAIGPIHDSRSGAAVMYRYGPRPIGEGKADGGPPVVHLGVVERMMHGCDDYAPVTLPASAKVMMPNGGVMALTEETTRKAMKSAYQTSTAAQGAQADAAANAFEKMARPDSEMVEQALDTVWWRQFCYFSLLGMSALLVAWPWIAEPLIAKLIGPTKKLGLLNTISELDYGLAAVVGSTASLLQGFLPSYAGPWLKVAIYYPVATTIVVGIAVIAWRMNSFLRDRIQERARLAWNRPRRMVANIGNASWLLSVARVMRLYAWPLRIAFTKVLLPVIFLFALFSVALLAMSRSYFNWRAGTGQICVKSEFVTPVSERPTDAGTLFNISKLCWPSSLTVEEGRKYRIWVRVKDPWFDRTIMSGANGFKLADTLHLGALPSRRSYGADWFRPVLRVGDRGADELPLEAVNVMPADDLPRKAGNNGDARHPVRVEDTAEFSIPTGRCAAPGPSPTHSSGSRRPHCLRRKTSGANKVSPT